MLNSFQHLHSYSIIYRFGRRPWKLNKKSGKFRLTILIKDIVGRIFCKAKRRFAYSNQRFELQQLVAMQQNIIVIAAAKFPIDDRY